MSWQKFKFRILDPDNTSDIELHEINGLYQHFHDEQNECEIPFIIYTNLDAVRKQISGEHLITNRLKIYKKFFNITQLFIKNYSENQFDQEIFDEIESLGININYRMNFWKSKTSMI